VPSRPLAVAWPSTTERQKQPSRPSLDQCSACQFFAFEGANSPPRLVSGSATSRRSCGVAWDSLSSLFLTPPRSGGSVRQERKKGKSPSVDGFYDTIPPRAGKERRAGKKLAGRRTAARKQRRARPKEIPPERGRKVPSSINRSFAAGGRESERGLSSEANG